MEYFSIRYANLLRSLLLSVTVLGPSQLGCGVPLHKSVHQRRPAHRCSMCCPQPFVCTGQFAGRFLILNWWKCASCRCLTYQDASEVGTFGAQRLKKPETWTFQHASPRRSDDFHFHSPVDRKKNCSCKQNVEKLMAPAGLWSKDQCSRRFLRAQSSRRCDVSVRASGCALK